MSQIYSFMFKLARHHLTSEVQLHLACALAVGLVCPRGLTGFECRCGYFFCATHRHAEDHACSFDHKAHGQAGLTELLAPSKNAMRFDESMYSEMSRFWGFGAQWTIPWILCRSHLSDVHLASAQ
eukprot:1089670-Amphidinium_carterae.1